MKKHATRRDFLRAAALGAGGAALFPFGFAKAASSATPEARAAWWQQMFSMAFDGHGNFVMPQLDALQAAAASFGGVGRHGVWEADLDRDMGWMRGHLAAFKAHPDVKKVLFIEGCSSTKVLCRVDADGRVLFTDTMFGWLNDPARRPLVERLLKPDGRTLWLGDWQFLHPQGLKTSLGQLLPTAQDLGLPPFAQPLDGSAITDEAVFWRTRSAQPLIGKRREDLDQYLKLSDADAKALGLAAVTTQRDGQWLVQSGADMLYDAQFARYQAAKARRALEVFAPDMIHYDDWDLRSPTAMGARADIHVAAFRAFVQRRFSAEDCRALGFEQARVADFDVLGYLLNPPWRGEYPGEGDGPLWRCASDARWLSNKIWRAFQIACVEDRLASMQEVYRLNKQSARTLLGHDVPMVANIIPLLSALYLQRDCVDMANFEWPCFKTYGAFPRPFGYYPAARLGIGPRMAAKIGTTGHALVSPYVEEQYSGWGGKTFDKSGHEALHKVIYFDLVANRGIPAFGLTWDGGYAPGSFHSAGRLHTFMNAVAPVISQRDYVADIGLAASSWSQIAAQPLFGGWKDEVAKRHVAEFLGWAQYLSAAPDFPQWDVVPFDDVRAGDLARFKLVILPSVLVITAAQLAALEAYVQQGGRLLVTGETGTFGGPQQLLMPHGQPVVADLARKFSGRVHFTADKPGVEFHLSRNNSAALHDLIGKSGGFTPVLSARSAPEHLGVYLSTSRLRPGEVTLDLVNYNHDLATDRLTPVAAPDFQIELAARLFQPAGALRVEAIRYDESAPHNAARQMLPQELVTRARARLLLRVPPFGHYQVLRLVPANEL